MVLCRLAAALLLVVAASSATPAQPAEPITTVTADGVTIYGEPFFADLDATAPLVLLFHQAGSNGRGEYADIAARLNDAGFRAIAWDQRSGGSTYGSANRTVAGLADGTPDGFCDAYPDLEAALDATQGMGDEVIVWGSSYSAALVVRLAADHPGRIAAVVAASPASGGPMVDCRARDRLDDVTAPLLVLRPASEMERASSVEQRDLFTAAGADFHVVEHGVHGSSMLVDDRTEHDMSDARTFVIDWLRTVTSDD